MEFSVETSPWLQVDVPGPYVTVSSQPAKDPSGPCGSLAYLQYQGYHLYLPEHNFAEETYFEFISKMLTVERIEQNGRKVSTHRRFDFPLAECIERGCYVGGGMC